ncbi:50S ribosomal protein L11 methyltransferase [Brevibacillus dissolubilis]|uniref:50S ribosomal protein L11 methyltransferase n=1 Tax=Brevibacillus dissolubilis TaxID=1844116 RepID=UPI0011172097|nr:50S ribosomal protein L11 methyltransferase [Brevibacillus dissolubilis]
MSDTTTYWLKYTLHLPQTLEEIFSLDILATDYTLGWIEPQVEVITTDNGYDYAERTDAPLTAYVFEPITDTEEAHTARLLTYLGQYDGQVQLITTEKVEEENESWKDQFQPVQVGKWLIAPSWTPAEETEAHDNILWIDPGAAFGTGYHGTTQDILLFLQEMDDLAGQTIIDIGAGSGILSIYCALQGAEQPVYAIDINPESDYEIRHNLGLNNLPDTAIEVIIGDASQPDAQTAMGLPEQADMIFINIGGDEDISMLPLVQNIMKPGGTLILSGMVEWNEADVEKAFGQIGYRVLARRQSEEWVTLLCKL